jgi:4-hydroxybenzoate polyprenyltransferase
VGCLAFVGTVAGILGALLACCIVAYDVVHKMFVLSPLLIAACRSLLYPLAASGAEGVTGSAVWCGLALGCYVAGLSFAARNESSRTSFAAWSFSLLGVPILLAVFMNAGGYREPALLASAILLLWILRSLRPTLWSQDRNIGRTVSALLAGIPLVDLVATVDAPRPVSAIFLVLFVLSLTFQKFIPAT